MLLIILYLFIIFILCPLICGCVISMTNKFFYSICGNKSKCICLATSIIGTPIHELGHAFFCIIFGHKIVDMKLLKWDENTLGYVSHTYNKKNIYHNIGNYFIGIGPIIFGGVIQLLLCMLLCPDLFDSLRLSINTIDLYEFNLVNFFSFSIDYFENLFSISNFANIWWWIYIIICLNIAIHMDLSTNDIKAAKYGILFLIGCIVLISLILYFVFYSFLDIITSYFIMLINLMIMFSIISIFFSLIIDVIGLLIVLFRKVAKKNG